MPLSFSPLLNGERDVVALFIGTILSSVPLSLSLHGVVLFFLSLFAVSVEIYSEDSTLISQRFKTRPGASSGILLGAVTLPAVMLSKLIQLTRGFSLHPIQLQDVSYVELQYWAVSASCFAVLLFVLLVNWHLSDFLGSDLRGVKLQLCCSVALPSALLFLSCIGSDLRIQFFWVLFHGVAAVILVLHLVNTFPSCASIGEALLVTAGLVLYFGDMLARIIIKFNGYFSSSELIPKQYGIKRNEINTIIQGLLLGLLIFPVVFKFILNAWNIVTRAIKSEVMTPNEKGRSIIFFGSLVLIMTVVIPAWIQFVQDFHVHPISWVLIFVFLEPFKRLSLCIYWICVIYLSALRFYHISKNSKIERILLRKYYHLMAVLMFLPAVIFQPKFLNLAFGVALSVFLALEIIRVWRIWPLGHIIHKFMNAFTDHRDSDILIVSHFSLLIGCALPIWMSSGYNDRPLAPFAGILSLGIGDTMASMVGHKYGVLRWSKTGKKTIEGTAAGITSVLAACSILLPLFASTGYILSQHWVSLLIAVVISGMLEAYTAQLDNAFIPLVFYSLLCL